jgi:hypothetical protein
VRGDSSLRKGAGAWVVLGVAAAATSLFVVSRLMKRRRVRTSLWLPPEETLSRTERHSLEEAREAGDIETVVTDIDLADRYDRYSG